MQIFSFPFRLLPNGKVATVEQGTPDAHAEAIAMLVMTRLGERPLAPSVGIPDPRFAAVSEQDVASAAATFLPDVRVAHLEASPVTNRTQEVTMEIGDANAQP